MTLHNKQGSVLVSLSARTMFQVPDTSDAQVPLTIEEKCDCNDELPHRWGITNLIKKLTHPSDILRIP